MFWERFYGLCVKNGEKPNPVAKKLGISSGAVSKWKTTGSTPSGEMLSLLADYFDVSTDYLLGRTNDPLSHKKNELAEIINQLNTEEIQKIISFYLQLKNEHTPKDNQ